MKKIKVKRYWCPKTIQRAIKLGFIKKDETGLIFDFSNFPEDYEVVIRKIGTKKIQQTIYQREGKIKCV